MRRIKVIFRIITDIIKKIRLIYFLRKYNDFTIADYFRKQGAIIGENNRIMIRSLGNDPYLIKIGNHCSISSGVALLPHDGGGWVFSNEDPSLQRFGKIEIKDNSYIGVNCILLPGITIGPNSIVGAGSVVTKNVPPNVVVGGNPAKFIKTIDEYKKSFLAAWDKQKPEGYFVCEKDSQYSAEEIQKLKDRDRSLLVKHLRKMLNE